MRKPPKDVAPVSRDGVRYEAVHWGKSRGMGQNGGIIAAVDEETGKELWTKKVWKISYRGPKEGDKYDNFVTALALDGSALVVDDERGNRFRLDLATRRVEAPEGAEKPGWLGRLLGG